MYIQYVVFCPVVYKYNLPHNIFKDFKDILVKSVALKSPSLKLFNLDPCLKLCRVVSCLNLMEFGLGSLGTFPCLSGNTISSASYLMFAFAMLREKKIFWCSHPFHVCCVISTRATSIWFGFASSVISFLPLPRTPHTRTPPLHAWARAETSFLGAIFSQRLMFTTVEHIHIWESKCNNVC